MSQSFSVGIETRIDSEIFSTILVSTEGLKSFRVEGSLLGSIAVVSLVTFRMSILSRGVRFPSLLSTEYKYVTDLGLVNGLVVLFDAPEDCGVELPE